MTLMIEDALAFSDAQLEERLDGCVHLVDTHDEELANDLWVLIDELTERHAPQIARMSLERIYVDDRDELPLALEGLRQREAARMIRDAIEGDDA